MPYRVFVTGGAGFIGSHVVDRLVDKGHTVAVFDSWETPAVEPIYLKEKGVTVYSGDVRDTALCGVMEEFKPHGVIHLAAHLEITQSQSDPYDDMDVNTGGTVNVLMAMEDLGIKGLVNASSACVYDHHGLRTLSPLWPYGVAKYAAERYVEMYSHTAGIRAISLRYGIVFGPREWYGRVLTRWLRLAKEGKPITVFGTGRQTRDFTPVHLAAGATVRAMVRVLTEENRGKLNPATLSYERGDPPHMTQDVGSGSSISMIDLAAIISRMTGAAMKFEDPEEGEEDSEGRTRIAHEMRHMVLEPGLLCRGLHEGVTLGAEQVVKFIEAMWQWIQATDLDLLPTWKEARV